MTPTPARASPTMATLPHTVPAIEAMAQTLSTAKSGGAMALSGALTMHDLHRFVQGLSTLNAIRVAGKNHMKKVPQTFVSDLAVVELAMRITGRVPPSTRLPDQLPYEAVTRCAQIAAALPRPLSGQHGGLQAALRRAEYDEVFSDRLRHLVNPGYAKDTTFIVDAVPSIKRSASTVASVVENGQPILLEGEPATGKTALVSFLARHSAKAARRMLSVHCSDETRVEDFFGSVNLAADGGTFFVPGPLTIAMRSGAFFLADELNLASPNVLQALVSVVEGRPELVCPTNASYAIDIHRDFRFFATQNDTLVAGRNALPVSLLTHLVVIPIQPMTEPEIATILRERFASELLDIASHWPGDIVGAITHLAQAINEGVVSGARLAPVGAVKLRELIKILARIQHTPSTRPEYSVMEFLAPRIPQANAKTTLPALQAAVADAFHLTNTETHNLQALMAADVIIARSESGLILTREGMADTDVALTCPQPTDDTLDSLRLEPQVVLRTLRLLALASCGRPEPVLLVGSTSYKTYTTKLFDSLLTDDSTRLKSVSLSRETTGADLLGAVRLMTVVEAAGHVATIARQTAASLVTAFGEKAAVLAHRIDQWASKFSVNHSSGELPGLLNKWRAELNDCIATEDGSDGTLAASFRLQVKFIVAGANAIKNGAGTMPVFKHGYLLSTIIAHQSILLKNFDHPSSAIMERFNSLFSDERDLRVTEDPTLDENGVTITAPACVRLYATISTSYSDHGVYKATDARAAETQIPASIRSRFTEIHTDGFTTKDVETVVSRVLEQEHHELGIDAVRWQTLLSRVCGWRVDFPVVLQVVAVASELTRVAAPHPVPQAIRMCVLGRLGPRQRAMLGAALKEAADDPSAKELVPTISSALPIMLSDPCPDPLLAFTPGALTSTLTGVQLRVTDHMMNHASLPDLGLHLTSSVHRLAAACMMGAETRIPVVLQGPPGVCKSDMIMRLAQIVGARVWRVNCSSSTTVADLFGRLLPQFRDGEMVMEAQPGALTEPLRMAAEEAISHNWVLLDELNLASDEILDALAPLFNPATTDYTPPGCETPFDVRQRVPLFATLNPAFISQSRRQVPPSMLASSLMLVVEQVTNEDLSKLTVAMFTPHLADVTEEERQRICFAIVGVHGLVAGKAAQRNLPLSLGIRELCKVRDAFVTAKDPDQPERYGAIIRKALELVYVHLLPDREVQIEIMATLDAQIPQRDKKTRITVAKKLVTIGDTTLQRGGHIEAGYGHSSFCRTDASLQVLEALSAAYGSTRAVLLSGPTACGKTATVREFATLMGQPLTTIPMSSGCDTSTLVGRFGPAGVTYTVLHKVLGCVRIILQKSRRPDVTDGVFSALLALIGPTGIAKGLGQAVLSLISAITRLPTRGWEDQERGLRATENEIRAQRFEFLFSPLVHALNKGHIILLDSVDAAPNDVLERLNSLLEERPELHIHERDGDCVVRRTEKYRPMKGDNKVISIHPSSRIILTINPTRPGAATLSSALYSRVLATHLMPLHTSLGAVPPMIPITAHIATAGLPVAPKWVDVAMAALVGFHCFTAINHAVHCGTVHLVGGSALTARALVHYGHRLKPLATERSVPRGLAIFADAVHRTFLDAATARSQADVAGLIADSIREAVRGTFDDVPAGTIAASQVLNEVWFGIRNNEPVVSGPLKRFLATSTSRTLTDVRLESIRFMDIEALRAGIARGLEEIDTATSRNLDLSSQMSAAEGYPHLAAMYDLVDDLCGVWETVQVTLGKAGHREQALLAELTTATLGDDATSGMVTEAEAMSEPGLMDAIQKLRLNMAQGNWARPVLSPAAIVQTASGESGAIAAVLQRHIRLFDIGASVPDLVKQAISPAVMDEKLSDAVYQLWSHAGPEMPITVINKDVRTSPPGPVLIIKVQHNMVILDFVMVDGAESTVEALLGDQRPPTPTILQRTNMAAMKAIGAGAALPLAQVLFAFRELGEDLPSPATVVSRWPTPLWAKSLTILENKKTRFGSRTSLGFNTNHMTFQLDRTATVLAGFLEYCRMAICAMIVEEPVPAPMLATALSAVAELEAALKLITIEASAVVAFDFERGTLNRALTAVNTVNASLPLDVLDDIRRNLLYRQTAIQTTIEKLQANNRDLRLSGLAADLEKAGGRGDSPAHVDSLIWARYITAEKNGIATMAEIEFKDVCDKAMDVIAAAKKETTRTGTAEEPFILADLGCTAYSPDEQACLFALDDAFRWGLLVHLARYAHRKIPKDVDLAVFKSYAAAAIAVGLSSLATTCIAVHMTQGIHASTFRKAHAAAVIDCLKRGRYPYRPADPKPPPHIVPVERRWRRFEALAESVGFIFTMRPPSKDSVDMLVECFGCNERNIQKKYRKLEVNKATPSVLAAAATKCMKQWRGEKSITDANMATVTESLILAMLCADAATRATIDGPAVSTDGVMLVRPTHPIVTTLAALTPAALSLVGPHLKIPADLAFGTDGTGYSCWTALLYPAVVIWKDDHITAGGDGEVVREAALALPVAPSGLFPPAEVAVLDHLHHLGLPYPADGSSTGIHSPALTVLTSAIDQTMDAITKKTGNEMVTNAVHGLVDDLARDVAADLSLAKARVPDVLPLAETVMQQALTSIIADTDQEVRDTTKKIDDAVGLVHAKLKNFGETRREFAAEYVEQFTKKAAADHLIALKRYKADTKEHARAMKTVNSVWRAARDAFGEEPDQVQAASDILQSAFAKAPVRALQDYPVLGELFSIHAVMIDVTCIPELFAGNRGKHVTKVTAEMKLGGKWIPGNDQLKHKGVFSGRRKYGGRITFPVSSPQPGTGVTIKIAADAPSKQFVFTSFPCQLGFRHTMKPKPGVEISKMDLLLVPRALEEEPTEKANATTISFTDLKEPTEPHQSTPVLKDPKFDQLGDLEAKLEGSEPTSTATKSVLNTISKLSWTARSNWEVVIVPDTVAPLAGQCTVFDLETLQQVKAVVDKVIADTKYCADHTKRAKAMRKTLAALDTTRPKPVPIPVPSINSTVPSDLGVGLALRVIASDQGIVVPPVTLDLGAHTIQTFRGMTVPVRVVNATSGDVTVAANPTTHTPPAAVDAAGQGSAVLTLQLRDSLSTERPTQVTIPVNVTVSDAVVPVSVVLHMVWVPAARKMSFPGTCVVQKGPVPGMDGTREYASLTVARSSVPLIVTNPTAAPQHSVFSIDDKPSYPMSIKGNDSHRVNVRLPDRGSAWARIAITPNDIIPIHITKEAPKGPTLLIRAFRGLKKGFIKASEAPWVAGYGWFMITNNGDNVTLETNHTETWTALAAATVEQRDHKVTIKAGGSVLMAMRVKPKARYVGPDQVPLTVAVPRPRSVPVTVADGWVTITGLAEPRAPDERHFIIPLKGKITMDMVRTPDEHPARVAKGQSMVIAVGMCDTLSIKLDGDRLFMVLTPTGYVVVGPDGVLDDKKVSYPSFNVNDKVFPTQKITDVARRIAKTESDPAVTDEFTYVAGQGFVSYTSPAAKKTAGTTGQLDTAAVGPFAALLNDISDAEKAVAGGLTRLDGTFEDVSASLCRALPWVPLGLTSLTDTWTAAQATRLAGLCGVLLLRCVEAVRCATSSSVANEVLRPLISAASGSVRHIKATIPDLAAKLSFFGADDAEGGVHTDITFTVDHPMFSTMSTGATFKPGYSDRSYAIRATGRAMQLTKNQRGPVPTFELTKHAVEGRAVIYDQRTDKTKVPKAEDAFTKISVLTTADEAFAETLTTVLDGHTKSKDLVLSQAAIDVIEAAEPELGTDTVDVRYAKQETRVRAVGTFMGADGSGEELSVEEAAFIRSFKSAKSDADKLTEPISKGFAFIGLDVQRSVIQRFAASTAWVYPRLAEAVTPLVTSALPLINENLGDGKTCSMCIAIQANRTMVGPKLHAAQVLFATLAQTAAFLEWPFSVVLFAGEQTQLLLKTVDQPLTPFRGQCVLDAMAVLSENQDDAFIRDAIDFSGKYGWATEDSPETTTIPPPDAMLVVITDGLSPQVARPDQTAMVVNAQPFSTAFMQIPVTDGSIDHGKITEALQMVTRSCSTIVVSDTAAIPGAVEAVLGNFARLAPAPTPQSAPVTLFAPPCVDLMAVPSGFVDTTTEIAPFFAATLTAPRRTDQTPAPATLAGELRTALQRWAPHAAEAATRAEDALGVATGAVQDAISRVGLGPLVTALGLLMPPNRPTKLEPSATGSQILVSELIKFILTNGSYTKIFGQRTGGLVRQYSVVLVVDASTSTAISPQHAEVAIIMAKALEALRVSVAIVTFSAAVTVVKPFSAPFSPTTSALLLAEVNGARPGSSLSDALSVAADMQTTGGCAGRRLVFALTDGASSASPGLQHCLAATCRVIGLCHSTFDPRRLDAAGFVDIVWALDSIHLHDAIRQLVDNPTPSVAAAPAQMSANPSDVPANVAAVFASQPGSNAFPGLCAEINDLGTLTTQFAKYFNMKAIDRKQYENLKIVTVNNQQMRSNPAADDSEMDFAKDGAFTKCRVLYCGGGNSQDNSYLDSCFANVKPALARKGFTVEMSRDPAQATQLLRSGEFSQVWVQCTRDPLNAVQQSFMAAVNEFWEAGGNVCFWADNTPWVNELNAFCQIAPDFQGLSFSGNYIACKYVSAVPDAKFGLNPGFRTKARADLDAGLNTVYEGETICEPNLTPDRLADRGLAVFMYSSDTKPAALYWEPPTGSATKRGKLFIDTAFTRLFCNWNTEAGGTSRYVLNIAAWLVWNARKGLVENVEYR